MSLSQFVDQFVKRVRETVSLSDKTYANHPERIEAMKHEIEDAIHGIEAQTIGNVLKNWVDRMGYCKASRGSHLNDVFYS